MSLLLTASITLISLALVFYSLGVWAERISRYLKLWHVFAFWTGFIFDMSGTWAMHLIAKQPKMNTAPGSKSAVGSQADVSVEPAEGGLTIAQLFENKADYALAHKFMKLTGVLKYKNKLMCELSGGEQQLAAIARALTQEPDLLLLDEPTSHLDISHQMQILNLIQQLNENMNLTVLMIIHDLNLAAEYCNYLVMMNEGEIFIKGAPKEVLDYTNIEEVYKTVVITHENPLSKKPVVLLVSEKTLNKAKND